MLPFRASRPLRSLVRLPKDVEWTDIDLSKTLTLPRTAFPARATGAQLQVYRRRSADELYQWQLEHRPRILTKNKLFGREDLSNEFVLHDGPPYANGAVHIGHALNKILKDLIVRWELSSGKRVLYRPGWDCHGLPIELKALQQVRTKETQTDALKDKPSQEAAAAQGSGLTASEIRAKARQLATQTIAEQKRSFREWGIMGEWDVPYKTMDKDFELSQLDVFAKMAEKGLISRKFRPVYWSPSSQTALAEAELEYDEAHKCTAAFVKMPLTALPKVLDGNSATQGKRVSALIWTTTPWTLPANTAIAVNEEIVYCLAELNSGNGEVLLLAKERLEHVRAHLPSDASLRMIREDISGADLADGHSAYYNFFQQKTCPVLSADFVTALSGTGLVHMAAGHGMEDYQVCLAHGLNHILAPVDDAGRFTAETLPADAGLLTGLDVQTAGVKAVLDILQSPGKYLPEMLKGHTTGLLLASHGFTHKNPIDWRTKQPVIVRATAQWFADVSAIRSRAFNAIDNVNFIPESSKGRLQAFLNGRSEWCISRQRAWGVPIPALYHRETGEACITPESINHIKQVIEERGIDAWFTDPADDNGWCHPSLPLGEWVRGKDTMDVWFDSGTTWTTLERRPGKPLSDVCVEGTDQHRGWFQSSLLTAIATQDENAAAAAPYGALVTHGFILDDKGRKMSKSIGNVIAPEQIVAGNLTLQAPKPQKKNSKNPAQASLRSNTPLAKKDALGPDLLRLWVASSDYTKDVPLSQPALQAVQQALQKYRVTFKFLLGCLNEYNTPHTKVPSDFDGMQFADQIILHQLAKTSSVVWKAYEEYKFHTAISEINRFINADLSAFYFEIKKDDLYTGFFADRRNTQIVLKLVFDELLQMLAPVVPHLVEEIWEHMPIGLKTAEVPTQQQGEDGETELVWRGGPQMEWHPLRKVWEAPFQLESDGYEAEAVEKSLGIFQKLSAAVKAAQEAARTSGKLGSGLACEVSIKLPNKTPEPVLKLLLGLNEREELAAALVVSGVSLDLDEMLLRNYLGKRNGDKPGFWSRLFSGSGDPANVTATSTPSTEDKSDDPSEEESESPEWSFSEPFDIGLDGQLGEVVVLPPEGEKCQRCWQYTAEDNEEPCERCQKVVAEAMGWEIEDEAFEEEEEIVQNKDGDEVVVRKEGLEDISEQEIKEIMEAMDKRPPGRQRPGGRPRR